MPACFVASCHVSISSNKTLQLDQWLILGSVSPCHAGRPVVRGRRLQVCRMLKSVVASFRLDSVPLTAVSILRNLGVTSLVIIRDLPPVNCATAQTGIVTYEISVISCLVLFCEYIIDFYFFSFSLRNYTLSLSDLGYKIILDYKELNKYFANSYRKSNKMPQCIKILFHIYMKLNMFRATHRPSS